MLREHAISIRKDSRRVVIFVHGLDGCPVGTWGAAESPGAFLRRVVKEGHDRDVLTIGYPARPLQFSKATGCTMKAIGEALAVTLLGQLERHTRLDVVAHCMGGLLAVNALHRLATGAADARRRVVHADLGLHLIDAPMLIPALPPPDWLQMLIRRLGVDQLPLQQSVDWLNSAQSTRVTVITSTTSWVRDFAPGAVGTKAMTHALPMEHDALPRAPAAGPFPTLEIVQAALAF